MAIEAESNEKKIVMMVWFAFYFVFAITLSIVYLIWWLNEAKIQSSYVELTESDEFVLYDI